MELKMEVAQTLALSQRMIQSAEILQMSSQELETYLKEMAVENPVIDIEEHYEAPKSAEDLQRKLEWLASSDEQNRVYYSEEYSGDDDSKQDMWNVTDHRGEDLATYLESQLMAVSLPEPERKLTNIPSSWTTTGCKVTTAITQPTRATGASCLRTTSSASLSSSGGAATRTDAA